MNSLIFSPLVSEDCVIFTASIPPVAIDWFDLYSTFEQVKSASNPIAYLLLIVSSVMFTFVYIENALNLFYI